MHPVLMHLEQAYLYWKELLKPSDTVIDATCGNGKDTQRLAELVPEGHVYALDIQEAALDNARAYAQNSNISFHLQCHTDLPEVSPKLVVYNLGYLPGGNKNLTSLAETTVKSLERAAELVVEGGAISITCYPRHAEGEREEKAVRDWLAGLQGWEINSHQWGDKKPLLYFICKLKNLL